MKNRISDLNIELCSKWHLNPFSESNLFTNIVYILVVQFFKALST